MIRRRTPWMGCLRGREMVNAMAEGCGWERRGWGADLVV